MLTGLGHSHRCLHVWDTVTDAHTFRTRSQIMFVLSIEDHACAQYQEAVGANTFRTRLRSVCVGCMEAGTAPSVTAAVAWETDDMVMGIGVLGIESATSAATECVHGGK
jgi:hypothetical protein